MPADEVLLEIEQQAKEKFLPIVGPERGRILAEIVRQAQPKHVLEIGTLIGYSAILIGKELGKNADLLTIEIDPEEAEAAEQNIRRAEILPKVKVLTGNALEILPKLENKFDLVFIDADKNEYFQYLRLLENRLLQGSVVVADNAGIFKEEMRDYLDYVRSSPKYASQYVPVGADGLEVSLRI